MLVSFICRMYIKKASCSDICVSHNSLYSLDLLSYQPPHLMRSRLVRELASKEKKINKTKEGQLDCPMASTCTHHFTHTYTRPCMHEQEHVHTPGLVFGLCSHYMMWKGWRMPFLSLLLHELYRGRHSLVFHWTSAGWMVQKWRSSRSTIHGIMTQNYVVSDCKLPSKLREECVKISHLKLALVIFLFLCVREFMCHVTHMEAREQLAEVGSLLLPSGFCSLNSGHWVW